MATMPNTTTDVEIKLQDGRTVRAALAKPSAARAPGLILIHEWWGLNDEMREVAARMAGEGYLALAVDLFEGRTANEPSGAKELMSSLDPAKAKTTLVGWIDWLRNAPGSNGKVGTLGFCLGGAWSLNASLAAPVDATVIYYGNVKKTAEQLKSLKGPVLGHFGRLDQAISVEMAEGFREALHAAKKSGEIHVYEANHAFSRLGGPNYDATSAKLAEQRTLEFLRKNLS
jgi:carboxymethylenebutenolidase